MSPYLLAALSHIANGRVVVEINFKARCGYIDSADGHIIRDPNVPDQKMGYPGIWSFYERGLIDKFARITDKGLQVLKGEIEG
ncbi:MAG: hypothetical protein RLW87_20660 [Alphaproteobacteria bacterium]